MTAGTRTLAFLQLHGIDAAAFTAWFRDAFEMKTAPWSAAADHAVLDIAVPPPPGSPYGVDAGTERPSYDVAVELWYSQAAAHATGESLTATLLPMTAAMHVVHATPTVIWDRQAIVPGQRTPGIKYMPLLSFHADLPDAAARRCWMTHANLARKVHVGCSRYVQNWVDVTQGVPAFAARGVPELFFPSDQDFVEGFFDSPRGRDEIVHDVSHFVDAGQRYFWRELVIA